MRAEDLVGAWRELGRDFVNGDGAVWPERRVILADRLHRGVVAELLESVDRVERLQAALEAIVSCGGGACQDEDCADRQCEPPHSASLKR